MGEILIRLRDLGVPVRERVLALPLARASDDFYVARAMVEAGHVADLAAAFDFPGAGEAGLRPRRNLRPSRPSNCSGRLAEWPSWHIRV